MNVLITGASGYIGSHLADSLQSEHRLICLYRSHSPKAKPEENRVNIAGQFHSFEDLQQLRAYPIDAVVHLAAVTGGCSEEDGLSVNVLGTRRLYRFLFDQGCRRFITASSIAATGCLGKQFVPLSLPIADDHPCLATDAYGMSKALLEQLIQYFHRQAPEASFTNLRFGAVVDDTAWKPEPLVDGSKSTIPFTHLSRVCLSDVIAAITAVLEAPFAGGQRNYNVVGPDASCDGPVADILRHRFGSRIDSLTAHYRKPGQENDAIFDMNAIRTDLGFVPQRSVRPQYQLQIHKGGN